MTRQRHSARDLAQIAVFAGLIAALGLPGGILVGSTSVTITFQTLGVMLAGAVLGARKGVAAVALFEVLVAAGLPLLSGGRGGISWFTTAPSAGYPWGWLLGALVIGLATRRLLPAYRLELALPLTALGGMAVVYAVGVPVTALNADLPLGVAFVDSLKFWPGDLIKVVVTVLVARQVHRAYPGLISRPGVARSSAWASDRQSIDGLGAAGTHRTIDVADAADLPAGRPELEAPDATGHTGTTLTPDTRTTPVRTSGTPTVRPDDSA